MFVKRERGLSVTFQRSSVHFHVSTDRYSEGKAGELPGRRSRGKNRVYGKAATG
jgi:hypothetical protein